MTHHTISEVDMAKKKAARRGRLANEPLPGDDYASRWANHFRELRQRKFETQPELAEALTALGLPVKANTVAGWEVGTRCPHLTYLPDIAKALGVTLAKLVTPPDWE